MWLRFSHLCLLILFSFIDFARTGVTCNSFYESNSDTWLQGEAPPVAFPLQLIAVFSYAPISFVFKTNLLLGDLYSTPKKINNNNNQTYIQSRYKAVRHPNDTSSTTTTKLSLKYNTVPFANYFDYNHFLWYWSQHKLQALSSQFYYFCFQRPNSQIKHDIIELKRIPEFQSYRPDEFHLLLKKNEAKFPFPNHRLVKIQGKFKMIGFYNFWNHLSMLQYVYQSLKPAYPIAKFSQALLTVLTNNFIAIHLRVDEEAFPSRLLPSKNTSKDIIGEESSGSSLELLQMMNQLKFSRCFQDLQRVTNELFIDPPSLYIITNANSKQDRKKVKYVIDQLSSYGFVNVFTRKKILDMYLRRSSTSSGGSNTHHRHYHQKKRNSAFENVVTNSEEFQNDLGLYNSLSIEQLQYVDILVSKSSTCFIPSQLPTILSYIITRFMKLDKNIIEDYQSVNRSTYGNLATYRDWGL